MTDVDDTPVHVRGNGPMDDTPGAAVELRRIPFGYHGSWVAADVAR